jgi:hypothetical protein
MASPAELFESIYRPSPNLGADRDDFYLRSGEKTVRHSFRIGDGDVTDARNREHRLINC